jgi:GNAT superfamily N-acetyltransferase
VSGPVEDITHAGEILGQDISSARAILRLSAGRPRLIRMGAGEQMPPPCLRLEAMPRAQDEWPFVIRRAGLADADPVGVLTERVYRQGGWAGDGYAPLLRDGRSRIEEGIVLVAASDGTGTIVGTVTLALPGSRFVNVCRADEIEVRMLAVAEEVRGRGIADRLMTAGEAIARERGCTAVVLSTEPGMHAAHRLYRRRGYARQSDRDWQVNQVRLLVFRLTLVGR